MTTPVCCKSTSEASSTLPSSSPAIVTLSARTLAGQLGAGLDGEIALDVDVALELAGDAHAAAAFDLAFDGDVGGDQRFLAGQAGVGTCDRRDWRGVAASSGFDGASNRTGSLVRGGRRGGWPGGRIVFPEGHDGGLSKWNFEASAKRGRRQSIRCKMDLRGIEGVHEHQGLRSSSRTGLRRVGTRANVIVTSRQPVGAAYAGTCSEVPSMHRRMNVLSGLPIGVAMFVACAAAALAAPLNVGSKRFTESYILGEIVTQTARGRRRDDRAHSRAWATRPSC